MDEKELMLALRRADEEGNTLLMIYHSHVDTEAYFSHADLAAALGPDGTPLYPGVAHLVIAVYEDGVRDATGFVWSDELARYRGHAVQQVG
jgi:proteasome lid subunit RPN8/RPN11